MVKKYNRGVNVLGRSSTISRKKRYLHFKKGPQKPQDKAQDKVQDKPQEEKKVKKIVDREKRWYTADDRPKRLPSRKNHHKPTVIRSRLTPGRVLIILAGKFKGKRVIFLRKLRSGLLLVTGPFKLNGVPLRRVNQAYVIATSATVSIKGVKASSVRDGFFKHLSAASLAPKKKENEAEFFKEVKQAKILANYRKAAQKAIDKPLLENIKKVPQMRHYLQARFSLTHGQYPHALRF